MKNKPSHRAGEDAPRASNPEPALKIYQSPVLQKGPTLTAIAASAPVSSVPSDGS
jgi:hypothetical protein